MMLEWLICVSSQQVQPLHWTNADCLSVHVLTVFFQPQQKHNKINTANDFCIFSQTNFFLFFLFALLLRQL